jgi:dTDP-4-dehydrorhamnose reductase
MLRLAREGRSIRVVDDQVLAPTFTVDLASVLFEVITRGGQGTFHITNAGQCSWYEFAATIFELAGLRPDLSPTTSEAYGSPARRPTFSVLENAHLLDLGVAQPRPWREALAAYLRLKGLRRSD